MEKLPINSNFFKEINNPEKAYWLGFLTADGCLHKKTNKVSICLSKLDKAHLKKFKAAISSDHKISEYSTHDNRTNKDYHHCSIQIHDETFKKNILQYIPISKSRSCRMPKLPNELISHFIRGLFDGDGSISSSQSRSDVRFLIGGTLDLLNDISGILNNQLNIKFGQPEFKGGNFYTISTSNINNLEIFFNYIYNDSAEKIRLTRKFIKAKKEIASRKTYITVGRINKSASRKSNARTYKIQIYRNNSFIKDESSLTASARFMNVTPQSLFRKIYKERLSFPEKTEFQINEYEIRLSR